MAIEAGPFFPSSKTCGAVKAKLPIPERTYRCEARGAVIDRDEGTARYLLVRTYASQSR